VVGRDDRLWQVSREGMVVQMSINNDAGAAKLPTSTELALDRTNLAHDRTLMAWIRTATSLISFGFTIYKFFQYLREQGEYKPVERAVGPREFALLMISLGLVSLLLATLQQLQLRKKLKRIYPEIGFPLTALMAGLISLLGILALIAVILRQ